MKSYNKQPDRSCPASVEDLRADARAAFEKALQFCEHSDLTFWRLEKRLFTLMAAVGVCLIRLFLGARYHRLDIEPFLEGIRS